MLLNLHKKSWMEGLKLEDFKTHETNNETTMKDMLELAKNYSKSIEVRVSFVTVSAHSLFYQFIVVLDD